MILGKQDHGSDQAFVKLGDTRGITKMDKEAFIKKMKQEFNDLNYRWSIERNKLEAKTQHLSAEARKTFEQELERLQKLRTEMKEKIVDLEVAGENAWYDVKEGTEKAWKALSKAFKKASTRFK
jgi:carbonic anhydrase